MTIPTLEDVLKRTLEGFHRRYKQPVENVTDKMILDWSLRFRDEGILPLHVKLLSQKVADNKIVNGDLDMPSLNDYLVAWNEIEEEPVFAEEEVFLPGGIPTSKSPDFMQEYAAFGHPVTCNCPEIAYGEVLREIPAAVLEEHSKGRYAWVCAQEKIGGGCGFHVEATKLREELHRPEEAPEIAGLMNILLEKCNISSEKLKGLKLTDEQISGFLLFLASVRDPEKWDKGFAAEQWGNYFSSKKQRG